MKKFVKKLKPDDFWRIGEHESWYSDMSKKGFHLNSIGTWFTKFEKGEPLDIEYRIEIATDKGEISMDQRQLYRESGWDYVTKNSCFHIFSSPTERNATEIHTDPAEQSYALEALYRKLTMSNMVLSIVIISIFIIPVLCLLRDATPYLTLINNISFSGPLLAVCIISYALKSIQSNISTHKFKRFLNDGKPIDHKANWKNHSISSRIYYILIIAIYISPLLCIIPEICSTKTSTLPDKTNTLPIILLSETEPEDASLKYSSANISDGINHNKQYTYTWNPLCPIKYDTYERAESTSKVWANTKRKTYEPSITSQVYKPSFDFIAMGLLTDLKREYGFGTNFSELTLNGVDEIFLQESKTGCSIFARSGKAVIYLEYVGELPAETLIKLLPEKLAIIEE
ncbi:MAG: DUF2812 domain-containing protein [Clostridium sp.]|uniref:DUF2812 domain-containing protein n=1 Tax=Clostridium sp. TaxID=1506 RepID=UPI003055A1B0